MRTAKIKMRLHSQLKRITDRCILFLMVDSLIISVTIFIFFLSTLQLFKSSCRCDSRIMSISSYQTPISFSASCPLQNLGLLGCWIIFSGNRSSFANNLTRVLYNPAIGSISDPESPNLVK